MFELKVSTQEHVREGTPPPHILMLKDDRRLWILRHIQEHGEMSLTYPDKSVFEEYVRVTGVRVAASGRCPDLKGLLKEMVHARYIRLEYKQKPTKAAHGEKKGYYAYVPDVYFNLLLNLNPEESAAPKKMPSLLDCL